jgi:bifunctional non-homologous end joining protein LigD
MSNDTTITVGNRTLHVGNLEKVFFPDDGISKGDVIDYYTKIAQTMLPHLRDRPLSLQRFPDGIDEEGFYQKEIPDYFPSWVGRTQVMVKEDRRTQAQVVAGDASTLAYLADQGVVTLHGWLSRAKQLDYPDKLIFDLDPPGDDFKQVRTAAFLLRDILRELDLAPFVMTTGSRGLHVVIPLNAEAEFDSVRSFAKGCAQLLAHRHPSRLTTETRKEKRQDRLFLDYLRNAYGQTGVIPYTIRARPGAPVAAPLDWDELQDSSLTSQSYTLKNIFRRLGQKTDPWQTFTRHGASLTEADDKLKEALKDAGVS